MSNRIKTRYETEFWNCFWTDKVIGVYDMALTLQEMIDLLWSGTSDPDIVHLIALGYTTRCIGGTFISTSLLTISDKKKSVDRFLLSVDFHEVLIEQVLKKPDYHLIRALHFMRLAGFENRGKQFLLDVLLPNKDFAIFHEWVKLPATAPAAVEFLASVDMSGKSNIRAISHTPDLKEEFRLQRCFRALQSTIPDCIKVPESNLFELFRGLLPGNQNSTFP